MPSRPVRAALAALILAACATAKPGPAPTPAAPPAPPRPAPPPAATLRLEALPGWRAEDHVAAFAAFLTGCGAARETRLTELCRLARVQTGLDQTRARQFFETYFRAEPLDEAGVLTAYFAPEYQARRRPDAEFSAPLRPRPADLAMIDAGVFDPAQAGKPGVARKVGGGFEPYPDRLAIETSPPDPALAWMRPEELFFLQIQGSGVLTFEDGVRRKASVAATNGRPFVGIANPMRERGLLAADNASGDAIRAWLAARRGPEADAVMRINPRYVFFNLAPDDGRPPAGAAGVPLPAGRSLAMDASYHAMGELFWLDASAPVLAGAFPVYRRLAVALDVGGAIKGRVRADLYLGQGEGAGAEAGRVRHVLRLYRLAPAPGLPGS